MHVPGVVYLMKRSELGLAAWCLGSWWCVLWIRNKLPLSNMSSSTRYNGSTGFGRYSPLGGAGKGVQEVHLICRLGYCRVAQSIGLVNTGPDQVSEPKEVEYFTQRTSTDTLGGRQPTEQGGPRVGNASRSTGGLWWGGFPCVSGPLNARKITGHRAP